MSKNTKNVVQNWKKTLFKIEKMIISLKHGTNNRCMKIHEKILIFKHKRENRCIKNNKKMSKNTKNVVQNWKNDRFAQTRDKKSMYKNSTKIINIETRDKKSMYRNSIKMSKKTKFPFLAGRQIYFFTKSVRIDEISVRSARIRYIFCQKNTPN